MFRFFNAQLKRAPSLLPLFILLGITVSGSLVFLLRVGARSPDYTWRKRENPEPWNKLPPTYQYKFVTLHTDYSKLKKDRPDF